MQVYDTTNGKTVDITYYIGGQDMASEIFGMFDDPTIVWNRETERLEGPAASVKWWADYISNRQQIDQIISKAYDRVADDLDPYASKTEYANQVWENMPTDVEGHTPKQAKYVIKHYL